MTTINKDMTTAWTLFRSGPTGSGDPISDGYCAKGRNAEIRIHTSATPPTDDLEGTTVFKNHVMPYVLNAGDHLHHRIKPESSGQTGSPKGVGNG